MLLDTLDIPDRIHTLVEAEIQGLDLSKREQRMTLEDFRKRRVKPSAITVNFSGGITQTCWMVTRSDGSYSLIYLPTADYFSLCVDSIFGPVDIGVHGPALKCFSAV